MADQPLFKCSSCGKEKSRNQFHEAKATDRKRPVTSRCRECRSEARYERLYPDQVCFLCGKHRKLDRNGICKRCNYQSGLRECRECHEILPMFLKFYGHRQACKDCCIRLASSPPSTA